MSSENPSPSPASAALRITAEHVELTLTYSRPTAVEMRAVRIGTVEWAWIPDDRVPVAGVKFGDALAWSMVKFTPPGLDDRIAQLPPTGQFQHLLVEVSLVDSETGTAVARRTSSWPPKFVAVVRAGLAQLGTASSDPAAAEGAVREMRERFLTVADLVRARAAVTCKGGM